MNQHRTFNYGHLNSLIDVRFLQRAIRFVDVHAISDIRTFNFTFSSFKFIHNSWSASWSIQFHQCELVFSIGTFILKIFYDFISLSCYLVLFSARTSRIEFHQSLFGVGGAGGITSSRIAQTWKCSLAKAYTLH